jgi:hypothetical protein
VRERDGTDKGVERSVWMARSACGGAAGSVTRVRVSRGEEASGLLPARAGISSWIEAHATWDRPLRYISQCGSCPGFNLDGSRDPSQWQGDNLTRAAKSAWLVLLAEHKLTVPRFDHVNCAKAARGGIAGLIKGRRVRTRDARPGSGRESVGCGQRIGRRERAEPPPGGPVRSILAGRTTFFPVPVLRTSTTGRTDTFLVKYPRNGINTTCEV